MSHRFTRFLILLIPGVLLLVAGCESDLSPLQPVPPDTTSQAAYVGAANCASCHQAIYDEFMLSGHPYKLNKVADGTPPTYPLRDRVNFPVANPPDGVSWEDVSYVIGGYGWKARFIGLDGYIITGSAVQWNMETGEWVAYHDGETKPYNCGKCHTTGYNPEGHQDGLEGMIGTWAEDGITCEACHGAGGDHVVTQKSEDITVDMTSAQCGRCHTRDAQHRIAAGGPDGDGDQFIKHHEQYDEMIGAGHRNLTCVSCHDPHKSVKLDEPGALVLDCNDCHGGVEVTNTGGGAHTCTACHMAHVAKSAVKRGPFEGDIASHIFAINPAADAEQFYQEDGSWFSNPFITTDFACLRCHEDKDRAWAEENAETIHAHAVSGDYVADSARCGSCHGDIYDDYIKSGHPYKLNKVVDGTPPTYPLRDRVNFPVVNPPDGVSWNDVSYVIGGYGWKARFIGQDGYIITGSAVQWNMETGDWVSYHDGETKPYDCGKCHTTGYSPEGNQDGMPGMIGTWVEDGITCQACHGPGAQHAATQNPAFITVDHSAAMCGGCHTRDAQHRIAAGGPDGDGDQFIKHHEQYDEMIAAGHGNLTCVTCHDPHKSTKLDEPGALVLDCDACHSDVEMYNTGGGQHTCTACHMAHVAKSAVKRGPWSGDIASHIFAINDDPAAEQFYQEDGSWFANGYITLGYACLNCHEDKDLDWAAQNAGGIHSHAGLKLAARR